MTLTTRLDVLHTTALPYCKPTTEPSSPTKHLIFPERAGPEDASRVPLPVIKRRHALIVALSYFWDSAASSIELIAALSVAAVDMAVDTPTSFSEPMKKGVALSSPTINLTSAAAGVNTTERATMATATRKEKKSCREKKKEEIDGAREREQGGVGRWGGQQFHFSGPALCFPRRRPQGCQACESNNIKRQGLCCEVKLNGK